jgi:hypothetical protein
MLTDNSLSAIMLGRLKLSVAQAKQHYEIIGEKVFKHHRSLAHKQVKYVYPELSSDRMEAAIREASVTGTTQIDEKGKSGRAYVINETAEKTRMRDDNQESART